MQESAFERSARAGRSTLLVGAYSPALVVLGLRVGPDEIGIALMAAGALGAAWWLFFLLRVVPRRQRWEIHVDGAEPMDRDVTAYVATYLLPILAAKPDHTTGYVAYGLVAALVLIVAYRADLGAVNPLAYLLSFRAYRVTSREGVRPVLSKSLVAKGDTCVIQQAAGLVVARSTAKPPEGGST